MIVSRGMAALTAAAVAGAMTCHAGEEPDKTPVSWRLVAQSHFIVEGTADVPVDKIRAAIDSDHHDYIGISVAVEKVLKGELADKRVVVRYFTRPSTGVPDAAKLSALNGQRVIAFLIRSDEGGAQGYYFAGHTPLALRAASAEVEKQAEREVQKQREFLKTFPKGLPAGQQKVDPAVRRLLNLALVSENPQQEFEKLESLGREAVPSMILLMDDRRPVPNRALSLRNAAGHWEAVRHYQPEVVADALAAILNQVTGESFGMIANGGSERERREAIHGWRIYLHHWNATQ